MSITVNHLRQIIDRLQSDSGYPYKAGDRADPTRAFAYGLAIGTLESLAKEWERRLNGGNFNG